MSHRTYIRAWRGSACHSWLDAVASRPHRYGVTAMTLLQGTNGNHQTFGSAPEPGGSAAGNGDPMRDDWLGLCRYLADAVRSGDVTVDLARAELEEAANDAADRRALGRAAQLAAAQLGSDPLVVVLLQGAANHGHPASDVA